MEAEMPHKCTPLCREAYFEVNSVKADGLRALFEVKMSSGAKHMAHVGVRYPQLLRV